MSVVLVSYCYRYQRRLWWQLSSLVEQDYPIKYCLCVCKDDPFDDLTKKIIKTFSNKLDLDVNYYSYEEFQTRGGTRNDALKKYDDWILFTDVDMIFKNNFFSILFNKDLKQYDINVPALYSVARYSTKIEKGYEFAAEVDFEEVIGNPYERVFPHAFIKHRSRGAGNFQLIYKPSLSSDLCYPQNDNKLDNRLKCFSDIRFRKKFGNTVHVRCSEKVLHISHYQSRGHGVELANSVLPL